MSIAAIVILTTWIGLYAVSRPGTHWGSFFGNAIADWSGVAVMVFATKYPCGGRRLDAEPVGVEDERAEHRVDADRIGEPVARVRKAPADVMASVASAGWQDGHWMTYPVPGTA